MNNHHHVAPSNILDRRLLGQQFGVSPTAERGNFVGAEREQLLEELVQIVDHQWRSDLARGLIKGFLLCGPPGTGKTTAAKRLAYELSGRFEEPGSVAPVVMAVLDGGEIARSRYGESEERIRDIFLHARSGFTQQNQRSVILFDDVESVFMARGNQNAKEWHFSQNSVFFHAIDDLDTNRSIVVLTSNRPDLIDEAIRDRFLTYYLGYPDPETMVTIAMNIADQQRLPRDRRDHLESQLRQSVATGAIRSIRDVERFFVQHYVANVLGRPSLARPTGAPPSEFAAIA